MNMYRSAGGNLAARGFFVHHLRFSLAVFSSFF